jgi:hypothetical protein
MPALFIDHVPQRSGISQTFSSGVDQRDRERHYDHAGESKIDIHGVSIQNMSDGCHLEQVRRK